MRENTKLCYIGDKGENALLQQERQCSNRRDRRSDRQKMDAELKAQSISGRDLNKYRPMTARVS